MPDCGNVSGVQANQSCPRGTAPTELAQQLRQGAESVIQSLGDPSARVAARRRGHQLLVEGSELLRRIGNGRGSAELTASLRAMEAALGRLAPDEAVDTVPTRSRNARQRSLAQRARRWVNIGARAMARSQDPEDFANAVAGDMSDRHMRALSQLSTDELRATLRAHGFSDTQTERAIGRLQEKIAGKYQRVIRQRALTAMQAYATQLERASDIDSPEFLRVAGRLMGSTGRGRDELLMQLELGGASVNGLRAALEWTSTDGAVAFRQLQLLLPPFSAQSPRASANKSPL